jgi:hypothetical protein
MKKSAFDFVNVLGSASAKALLLAIAILSLIALPGCKTVETINQSAAATMTRPASTTPAIPQLSAKQADEMRLALSAPLPNAEVSTARTEASSLISHLSELTSCVRFWPKVNARLVAPEGNAQSIGWGNLVGNASTAPANMCWSVVRSIEWRMPTRNTLAFCNDYVSDHSGEGGRACYLLLKGSDGVWLLKDSRGTLSFG